MSLVLRQKNTQTIKAIAKSLGFEHCGISKSGFLEEEAPRLESWLNANMHGEMDYMENHFDKRLDTTKLVEGSKSVISLLLNYFPEPYSQNSDYKISKYALGEDYHFVIKDKLKLFLKEINAQIGEVHGRAFVDSAPLMDKAWAKKSGIGWIGKNANLINRTMGSFFFIAELIVDIELEEDKPINDYCGTCTKCIDACPTNAITEPYVVDGSKCISYFTIELKNNIPEEYKGKFENWAFGCDICQDVCPWNRFSYPTKESRFKPTESILSYNNAQWQEITQELFNGIFKKSPIKRTKLEGLKRNINFLS